MKVSGELRSPAALLPEPAVPFIKKVAGLTAVLDISRDKTVVLLYIEARLLGHSSRSPVSVLMKLGENYYFMT